MLPRACALRSFAAAFCGEDAPEVRRGVTNYGKETVLQRVAAFVLECSRGGWRTRTFTLLWAVACRSERHGVRDESGRRSYLRWRPRKDSLPRGPARRAWRLGAACAWRGGQRADPRPVRRVRHRGGLRRRRVLPVFAQGRRALRRLAVRAPPRPRAARVPRGGGVRAGLLPAAASGPAPAVAQARRLEGRAPRRQRRRRRRAGRQRRGRSPRRLRPAAGGRC